MSAEDWFPADEPLREHELLALKFLADNGPHEVGPVGDEETFAAAMTFVGLMHKGMVIGGIGAPGNGPAYRLTNKGREAASGMEARKGGDVDNSMVGNPNHLEAAPSRSDDSPTEGDAQPLATPPSSGTQSPPPDNTDV